jgi:hypothetical protein
MADDRHSLMINRAPVLTLWAAVVAEHLGFDRDEALTLGRAVAGLNAYAKGKALGIFSPTPDEVRKKRKEMGERENISVDLLHRAVPAVQTPKGLRALSKDKAIKPESVWRYLESTFGEALDEAYHAMSALAGSLSPHELSERGFKLYEQFRPAIPSGPGGWGAKGRLDLDKIRALAKE